VFGHKIHGGRRDELRGHDEVALVLAVGVIHDDDHSAFAEVGDDGFDGVEMIFHAAGLNLVAGRQNVTPFVKVHAGGLRFMLVTGQSLAKVEKYLFKDYRRGVAAS
jgi:hypothetical protein